VLGDSVKDWLALVEADGNVLTADPISERSMVPRLGDGAAFCASVYVAARLLLSFIAVVGVGSAAPNAAPPSGYEQAATPGWHNAVDGTDRWDAAWFERIAVEGYGSGEFTAASFPAYPLATSAVSLLGLGTLWAALLVSNLAFLGALIVLYALTELEYSTRVARRTVLLVALFPTSFFFLAPLSESLFLLLTVLAFWFVRRGRSEAGGLSGGLAAATRSVGIVLLPALLLEAWASRKGFLTALLVALGPMLYGIYWLTQGDMLRPITAQAHWERSLELPFVPLAEGLRTRRWGPTTPGGSSGRSTSCSHCWPWRYSPGDGASSGPATSRTSA
jgi:mannosyltransferase PIG-V